MPPLRKKRRVAQGGHRKKTRQSTTIVEKAQTAQKKLTASTSRGHDHTSTVHKASACRPALDKQPTLPSGQSIADCSGSEQNQKTLTPELLLKHKRGQKRKAIKVAPKKSKVCALGSSRNPPADPPNKETHAAPLPANTSQLLTVKSGSGKPSVHVADHTAVSSGDKETEGRRMTRSLSKSLEELHMRKSTVCDGVSVSGHAKRKVRETPSRATVEKLGNRKRAKRRGSPPVAQEATVTSPGRPSPHSETSQVRNVSASYSSRMAPKPSGQHNTRALSRLQTEEAPTNAISKEVHKTARIGGFASAQRSLSRGAVTKTPHVQERQTQDTPESHFHETSLKAGPSSSRLNSHRRLLFKKNSLKSNTLQKDTQNIQVNTLTSEQQLMSDDAVRSSQSATLQGSQGSAETSSTARKIGSTGKKTARMSAPGKAANAPESRTNETGLKAGPSSSPLNWQQRLLLKKDSLKSNTLQKDTQNIQVNTRTSEQQLMSDDAVRSGQNATLQGSQGDAETSSTARKMGSTIKKTARMSAPGKAANVPESRTNETGPSSSPLNWRHKLLFEKDSLESNTLQNDTQNIQVNTRTSEQQLMSDDAVRSGQNATLQGSQGDAETSSTARKMGSTIKKTARMSARGKATNVPESRTNETGPSSCPLNWRHRLLFEKDSLESNTLQNDTQNFQVNTSTSDQQLMSDDAVRSSQNATLQGSQGSAETSSTAREMGSTLKKTARMSAPGKAANAPESCTNETGFKAGPSSSPLNWQQRLLFKKDSLKIKTLQKDTQNIQVNTRTSEQQLMSDDAARSSQTATLQGSQGSAETSSTARKMGITVKKTARMSALGQVADAPESRTNETGFKAGPSSSPLNWQQRLLFKKDSLKINTLQKDTQNIQVNTRTSEQQLMLDDAARSSQSATLKGSQGSAETSSTARKIGSTGKKTARMSAPGKAANAPGSCTNETGFKAGPSSSPLNWQQRLLFKKDSVKINTLQKYTQNIQVNTRTSEQQLMLDDAARSSQSATLKGSEGSAETSSTARKIGSTGKKTARMSAPGKAANAPESCTNETGFKAGPSSSPLNWQQRLLFKKDSVKINTLQKDTQNIQVNTRTPEQQPMSDDAAKSSQSATLQGSQGSAETSITAHKMGITVKKTARMSAPGQAANAPESRTNETGFKAGSSSSPLNWQQRLLFKKDSLKINTLQKDIQNIQVNTLTSEQQLMSDDAARSSQSATLQGSQGSAETSSTARKIGSTGKKTARMAAPGKAANAPESRTNETGLKAGPSSSPLNWQQRLLLKKDSLKSNTLQKDTQNIQVNARTSEQLMSNDAARSSQNATLQGIQGDPEMSSTARKKGGTGKRSARMVAHNISKTNVLAQTPPKRHSFKRPSAETFYAEVEPSGDKTVKTQKSSPKMQESLGITLSNREHTPGNSRSRRFRSRRQVEGRGDVLAQSPRKGHRSNRPTAETSHAEAGPSGYKAARTQKSLQEMPQSPGITPPDEEHASGSSRSYNLRSRRQAEGRGDGPQTEHVPENTARITSLAPQQRIEWEKLRARPRHLWKRKAAQEPVFVVEDGKPSRRTPSSSSKGKMAGHNPSPISGGKADAATLLLSPAPLSAASSSDEGYPGKLGFHWYEKTFGMLQCEQANAVNDVESLHWKSDSEECESKNDSSDVDSGEDLSVLPWHDTRSSQFSDDLEPNRQRLDRWQENARKRVQAHLPGVRVTNRAWETIDKWHDHFMEKMGQSVQAMAERVGHDQIEEEDVVWFIHRHLGTADPSKLWALADKLLPGELRNQIYPATRCSPTFNDAQGIGGSHH